MTEDNHADRLLSEPPELTTQPRDRTGSMSLGDEHRVEPTNGDITVMPVQVDHNVKDVHDVVNSELGVSTLLNRLKQSIASAKVSFQRAATRAMLTQWCRNLPSS